MWIWYRNDDFLYPAALNRTTKWWISRRRNIYLHNISKGLYIRYHRYDRFTFPVISITQKARLLIINLNQNYPCLCLCFGFSQMILIAPFLLITLHFSQIGFTDDLTFISKTPFWIKSTLYTNIVYYKFQVKILKIFWRIYIKYPVFE